MLFILVVQSLNCVQLFCDPMDCSLAHSSVHGTSQAGILERVATSYSRGSSRPRNRTWVSCIVRQILYHWATVAYTQPLLCVYIYTHIHTHMGFCGGSDVKESACSMGDLGSIPGLGRSPGEGHGNPLQYSCLENPHGENSLRATVRGVTKSRTWLSD